MQSILLSHWIFYDEPTTEQALAFWNHSLAEDKTEKAKVLLLSRMKPEIQ
jgi:hypothetical protein